MTKNKSKKYQNSDYQPEYEDYQDPFFDEYGSFLGDNADPDDPHIRLRAGPSNFLPEFLQAIKAYGEGKPYDSKFKGIFDTMDVNKNVDKLMKSKLNLNRNKNND